jgi:hypothetical protein
MRALALAPIGIAVVAACDPPPLTLRYKLTDGDAQACVGDTGNRATQCSQISMLCDAVLSVRIVPPNDPAVPYVSVCQAIEGNDLCHISEIALPQPSVPVPEQTLELQVAVFPASAVPRDPVTGNLQCPTNVRFAATGLPIAAENPCSPDDPQCPPVPAIGGRAFYQPGDEKTVVTLGCTDQPQLTACAARRKITVFAAVHDFTSRTSVGPMLADRLALSVGEPQPEDAEYVLALEHTRPLMRSATATPTWHAEIADESFDLVNYACVEVLETVAQATSSVVCRADFDPALITFTGVRLDKSTLRELLDALELPRFPDAGLTVGIVVDHYFEPAAGIIVTTTGGSVEYLSADRKSTTTTGTSNNGIFLSQDAPFGTQFSALVPNLPPPPVIGGRLREKVTIAIIQLERPTIGD